MADRVGGAAAPRTDSTVTSADWSDQDISGQTHTRVTFVNLDMTEAQNSTAAMEGSIPASATLVHQGERESMYLADIAKRVILVVLFDQRTTLGLVKLKGRGTVLQLNKVFEEMFNRVSTGPSAPGGLLEGAEDEIDKLFG